MKKVHHNKTNNRSDSRVDRGRRPRDIRLKKSLPKNDLIEELAEALDLGNLGEKDMTDEELRRELERRAEAALGQLLEGGDTEEVKKEKSEEADRKEEGEPTSEYSVKAGDKSGQSKKQPVPQLKKTKDGFESTEEAQLASKNSEKLAPARRPSEADAMVFIKRPGKENDPMTLLNEAQPPGVYFKEGSPEAPLPELEDPDLLAAVEEAKELLQEVEGIHRIAPGLNQEDEKAIIIVTERGFGEASLRQIPPDVRQFPTVLAIPYDLLPLRRIRSF